MPSASPRSIEAIWPNGSLTIRMMCAHRGGPGEQPGAATRTDRLEHHADVRVACQVEPVWDPHAACPGSCHPGQFRGAQAVDDAGPDPGGQHAAVPLGEDGKRARTLQRGGIDQLSQIGSRRRVGRSVRPLANTSREAFHRATRCRVRAGRGRRDGCRRSWRARMFRIVARRGSGSTGCSVCRLVPWTLNSGQRQHMRRQRAFGKLYQHCRAEITLM